jgi:hypothetical protein
MSFTIALVSLATWLLGVVGVHDAGTLVHVFLQVGLMLLMIASLRVGSQNLGTLS